MQELGVNGMSHQQAMSKAVSGAKTVGKSSGGARFFAEVMRAFKSMGPMG